MKTVFLVQANLQYGKALYFPYATACLAAYAWQFEEIQENYSFEGILYKREPIPAVLPRYKEADIIAFSCFDWCMEYTKSLARAIKEINPDCTIIFGGHSVSESNHMLEDYNFVDYLIFGEGERPFKALLDAFAGEKTLDSVPNIAYRKNGKIMQTARESYRDLEGYLSPYLEGYFDEIIAENPQVEFCGTIETNRGCPHQCAFCNWCYEAKIRKFDLEKIKAEIIWCAENKIEYIFCADANFGILKRDLEIAEFVVSVRKQYGYPYVFNACYAKNSNDTVYNISKLFYDNHLNKAITLAYQSVNPVALKNVGRENFTMEAFAGLVKKYNDNNIPTYTELILGLPGETYDSFCDGVCQIAESGQQSALTVYCCEVFANAKMGSKEYRKKHGIKTVHVPINFIHSSKPKDEDVREYIDLVMATNTMPFEDITKAIMFCCCLQCFHYLGLLRYFAIYLNKEKSISFKEFYRRLFDYIFSAKNTYTNALFERIHLQCTTFSNGEWTYYDPKFGEFGWYLEEGAFMELISRFDEFWSDILPFLRQFDIEAELFEELLKYQKFSIKLPNVAQVSCEFEYDFYNYFKHALFNDYEPLQKRKNRIEVIIPDPVRDWEEYGRRVMLYEKKKAGTFVTGKVENVKQTYLE